MVDIARERRLLNEQGLEIRQRNEWGARFNYGNDRTVTAVADDFFLHIAVVRDLSDLRGEEDEVARNIEDISIERFSNTGFAYNALSFNTGRLYEGQPLTRRGAHTYNDFHRATCPTHGGDLRSPIGDQWNLNYNTRALCLPQMVDDPVTDEQIDSAARWAAAQIRAGLAKETARWHGHRDVTAKDCPGNRGYNRIDDLDRLTNYYVTHGLEEDMATAQENWHYPITVTGEKGKEKNPAWVELSRANYRAQRARELSFSTLQAVEKLAQAVNGIANMQDQLLKRINVAVEEAGEDRVTADAPERREVLKSLNELKSLVQGEIQIELAAEAVVAELGEQLTDEA